MLTFGLLIVEKCQIENGGCHETAQCAYDDEGNTDCSCITGRVAIEDGSCHKECTKGFEMDMESGGCKGKCLSTTGIFFILLVKPIHLDAVQGGGGSSNRLCLGWCVWGCCVSDFGGPLAGDLLTRNLLWVYIIMVYQAS